MRYSRNIFETENHRGTGTRSVSGTAIVFIVLTIVSALAAAYIIANFNEVTARIAIGMANVLSSDFPILFVVIVIIYFVMRIKRRMHRRFWGW